MVILLILWQVVFFVKKYIYFVLPCPKWDYHSSLFTPPSLFFPKIKQTESKMVWYAYRSWATTIQGFRGLVTMSNFKCGEIKENIDLVYIKQCCHKFSSLMFEQGLWSALSFQNPFSWNKDWSFLKKDFFFLKSRNST